MRADSLSRTESSTSARPRSALVAASVTGIVVTVGSYVAARFAPTICSSRTAAQVFPCVNVDNNVEGMKPGHDITQ